MSRSTMLRATYLLLYPGLYTTTNIHIRTDFLIEVFENSCTSYVNSCLPVSEAYACTYLFTLRCWLGSFLFYLNKKSSYPFPFCCIIAYKRVMILQNVRLMVKSTESERDSLAKIALGGVGVHLLTLLVVSLFVHHMISCVHMDRRKSATIHHFLDQNVHAHRTNVSQKVNFFLWTRFFTFLAIAKVAGIQNFLSRS